MESKMHHCKLGQATLQPYWFYRQALYMNACFLISAFKRLVGEIPNIKTVQIVRMVKFIFFDSKIKHEKV